MGNKGKNILILGCAESGTGAALLAQQQGYDVFVSDSGIIKPAYKEILRQKNILFEEMTHDIALTYHAGEVIKSPGIPDSAPIIRHFEATNTPLISEIEFAARFTDAKKICITGSNGKTTTTKLICHILQKAGIDAVAGGNVGRSFAWIVAEEKHDVYVLEISSFQLDYMFSFKADVAVITNITPDHLDRYNNNFELYAESKFRILNNMDEYGSIVYWHDDTLLRERIENGDYVSAIYPYSLTSSGGKEGAWSDNDKLIINIKSNITDMTLETLALQGRHNLCNSMAAGIVARLFDIRKDVIKESLSDFQGVEHRLEFVSKVHGIEFINDSKATNVNSTWYALESMNKPVIWIVGGIDKGNDYLPLKPLVRSKVKAIICLGLENEKIHEEFSKEVDVILDASSAKEAVERAYTIGKPGDVVLLSPACASFDLFENFEDRGLKFKKAVFEL